jgi:hypothetical protein
MRMIEIAANQPYIGDTLESDGCARGADAPGRFGMKFDRA